MAARAKGLGKGLGSLLGDVGEINILKDAGQITDDDLKQEKNIKIRLIEPNRDQPRKNFNEEDLNDLAESIRIHGIIQPLIVTKRGDHYQIIAGERRWRAAKIAGLKDVPVIVKDYSEEEIAEIALIENIQRKDLNPVEEARAYKKLIEEYNLTQDALSERISKNRTVIANSMRILKLPDDILTLVAEETLSVGHAKVLLSLTDTEKQRSAAKIITEKHLSVRESETLIKGMLNTRKSKDVTLPNQLEYDQAAGRLVEKLGTKVKINRRSENKGRIEIDYYSLEELERIIAHIK